MCWRIVDRRSHALQERRRLAGKYLELTGLTREKFIEEQARPVAQENAWSGAARSLMNSSAP